VFPENRMGEKTVNGERVSNFENCLAPAPIG